MVQQSYYWVKFLVKCPFIIAIVAIVIPIYFIGVSVPEIDLSIESSTWGDPKDSVTLKQKAFATALENIEKSDTSIDKQSIPIYPLILLYEGEDPNSNVFMKSLIKSISKLEQEIISEKNYSYHCVLENNGTSCSDVESIIPDLTTNKKTEQPDKPNEYPLFEYGEDVITQEEIDNALVTLSEGDKKDQFGKDFDSEKKGGRYFKSVFYSGLPLEGYQNENDERSNQNSNYQKWTEGIIKIIQKYNDEEKVNIYFGGNTFLILNELYSMLVHDYLWLLFSFLFVFLYLWLMTKSGFLASFGMFHIILTIPLAFLIYNKLFDVHFMSTINIAGLYIIFAIGADDIFIFLNFWKHSRLAGKKHVESLFRRMLWAYPKAAKATLITSFTIAWSFILTAFSPIAEISVFGIFAASLVISNYIFVITLFPAIIVIYEKYFSQHHLCLCCAFPRTIPGGLLQYEKEQKIYLENICNCCCKNKKGKGKDKGVTWANSSDSSDVEKNDKGDEKKSKGNKAPRKDSLLDSPRINQKRSKSKRNFTKSAKSKRSSTNNPNVSLGESSHDEYLQSVVRDPEGEFSVNKLKVFDRFMYTKLSPFLTNKVVSWTLVILFTCLTVVMILQVTSLEPSSNSSQDYPDWSNTEKYNKIINEEFETTEETVVIIHYSFGLKKYDISDINTNDPDEKGTLIYDEAMDFKQTENQEYFLQICEQAFQEEGLLLKDNRECIMSDFKNWIGNDSFPVVDQGNYELSQYMKNFTQSAEGSKYFNYVDYDGFGNIKFISTPFKSTLTIKSKSSYSKLKDEYEKWEEFQTQMKKSEPNDMKNSQFTADGAFIWMKTQQSLVDITIWGASSSAFIALIVITLACRNWVVGFLSFFTISFIVINTLGFMKILGWELGVIESIAITILAGLTVDYVVHLAHAYHEINATSRHKKVQGALYAVGSSVLAGFITTFGSAIPLLFCYLETMYKFGVFLMLSLGLTFIYTFFFLMPLLSIFGPKNRHEFLSGNFCRTLKKKKKTTSDSSSSDSDSGNVEKKSHETSEISLDSLN
ncbi:sterol-sensing domain [Anaeramoeba flamelloides]|uniref:Sterol-sensing domain n=1 Tax=Anaeramoeba flamelloides TaxID=1746091 RepID=A0ABQ8YLJ4_9EUKA|nr:sterol-sensing domain [Anaeramoeba flamelloides]